MAIDYTSVMRQIAKRRKKALKLRDQGKTYEQIGDELGVSKQRAERIVKAAQRDNGGA